MSTLRSIVNLQKICKRNLFKWGTGTCGLFGLYYYSIHITEDEWSSYAFVRLFRAGFTVFRIGIDYKWNLYKSGLDTSSDEFKILKSKTHEESAKKLLNLCCTNKGVYIKIGQHIGTLDYLVPSEYIQTLKVLHADAPKSSFSDVCKVLKNELKKDVGELFEWIDEEPIGAASLAQVHRAKLKDGPVVAVKVQHVTVFNNSLIDMKTMEILVNIVSKVFEDFKFDWLVSETKKNLPRELDFAAEGKNAEEITTLMKNFTWLKIPSVHWSMTTSRVLTMDYLEGGQVNNISYMIENNIKPSEVINKLGLMYSTMIFKHGFVHSDPHPGNILVRKNKTDDSLELVLLDHGLYATLTDEFKYLYSSLWLSILNVDEAGMKESSEKLGIGRLYPFLVCMITGRTWESVRGGVDKVPYTQQEKEIFQKEIPNFLNNIMTILQNVNREMLLLLKTNDLLRGIEHTLKTEKRRATFIVMTKHCTDCVYNQMYSQSTTVYRKLTILMKHTWSLLKLDLITYYYICLSFTTKLFGDKLNDSTQQVLRTGS